MTSQTPVIYLDQNALDDFVNKGFSISEPKKYLIAYSGATLEELKKVSDEYIDDFLDFLDKENAIYVWIEDDYLKSTKRNPKDIFKEKLKEDQAEIDILTSMKALSQKMYGGKKDISFEEIVATQRKQVSNIFKELIKELDKKELEMNSIDLDFIEHSTNLIFENLSQTLQSQDEEDFELSSMRSQFQKSPIELNNFSSEEVFEFIIKNHQKDFGIHPIDDIEDYIKWEIWNTMNSSPTFSNLINYLYHI